MEVRRRFERDLDRCRRTAQSNGGGIGTADDSNPIGPSGEIGEPNSTEVS